MSRLTTAALEVFPFGSTPAQVTSGSAWVSGTWVEIIPSAPAALHVAGISLGNIDLPVQVEIDIGVGALGVESPLHTVRNTVGSASAESNGSFWMLPIPVGGIQAGDRVSVRTRTSFGVVWFEISLFVYRDLTDTDHRTSLPIRSAPSAANAVLITPSATPWAYSDWVEITSGLANEVSMLGITSTSIASVESEFEIGFGAGGAEVSKTSLRLQAGSGAPAGPPRFFPLPGAYPVSGGTRISVRMRKSGTSTTTFGVALVYLDTTLLVSDAITLLASEAITVTDHVTVQLSGDLHLTVAETITVQESVALSPNVLLIRVAELVGVVDDADLPADTAAVVEVSDRIFVRDYVALAPNTLVVIVHETITVAEGPLYPGSNGVAGDLGSQPAPPAGTTGIADYWATGI